MVLKIARADDTHGNIYFFANLSGNSSYKLQITSDKFFQSALAHSRQFRYTKPTKQYTAAAQSSFWFVICHL